MRPILCRTGTKKGLVMWLAERKEDFDASCRDLRRNGERYRRFCRGIKAGSDECTVWVLVIYPKKEG